MQINEYISIICLLVGVFFFIAGIFGLLRFPDIYCRLHALTKADNLGLFFIILGISIEMADPKIVIKLLLIWMLVLIASATSCYLIARAASRMGISPKE